MMKYFCYFNLPEYYELRSTYNHYSVNTVDSGKQTHFGIFIMYRKCKRTFKLSIVVESSEGIWEEMERVREQAKYRS